jgi:hypothetical protein
VSVVAPHHNAVVGPANVSSQPWVEDVDAGSALYFSFYAPLADGGPAAGINACGRAVFADTHVAAASGDVPNPPEGCTTGPLSPQERVIEFMLFGQNVCVSYGFPPPPAPDGGE